MTTAQKIQTSREIRQRAARIRNWYAMPNGEYRRLTLTEARKLSQSGKIVERVDIEKELELDELTNATYVTTPTR